MTPVSGTTTHPRTSRPLKYGSFAPECAGFMDAAADHFGGFLPNGAPIDSAAVNSSRNGVVVFDACQVDLCHHILDNAARHTPSKATWSGGAQCSDVVRLDPEPIVGKTETIGRPSARACRQRKTSIIASPSIFIQRISFQRIELLGQKID